jgi:tight adherence protein C
VDVLMLYAGAAAVVLGLGAALALAVSGRQEVTGVARSLALIEQQVRVDEVARNELPASERLTKPVLAAMRSLALRLSPSGTVDRLAHLLDMAGNPQKWTVERLLGAKGGALVVLGLLGLLLGGGVGFVGLMAALAGAVLGFFLPDLLVYNTGIKRQDQLRRGLADALDMLTVCVEAGQGFDSALMQVARSVTGRPRGEAFSSLSRRTNVPEVKTFVTALVQADRMGLPIGSVLREQAHQMRLVRRQRAEEQAQKVPVKILFPLMLCILPSLFIVVIGPGVLRMIATFAQMNG